MFQDAHGLDVTAATAVAVQAFDHALMGYVSYRADIPQRMAALFEADPEFGLAHCLKGYFAMLSYKQAAVPIAEAAAADARRFTERATPRERAHIAPCSYGSTAHRIVRRRSGSRSWTTIRATCWPSAWHISSTSGWARPDVDAGVGAGRRTPLERGPAGLWRHPRMPLLRA